MENLILSVDNILSHLNRNCSQRYLQIIKLLEKVEQLGCESKTQQYKILDEVLLIVMTGSKVYEADDSVGAISCVIYLTYLQEQQKLPCLNGIQFVNLLEYVLQQYKYAEGNVLNICRTMIAFGNLFTLHPGNGDNYVVVVLQLIMKNISSQTVDVLLVTTLQCLNKILSILKDMKLSDENCAAIDEVGCKLLQLQYGDVQPNIESYNISDLILHTFEILDKIVQLNKNFCKLQTGELLGLAKTYFHFGLHGSEILLLKPQKIYISQQSLNNLAEEIEAAINSEKARSCGGKTLKRRKPRALAKTMHLNDQKINSSENRGPMLVFDMKTSDSELSEPDVSNRILFVRNTNAKIRIASINLVGSIVRLIERKTLFGYWHALFPNGAGDSIDNLLYIGQHDPSLRCRGLALQNCAFLLYGSKAYLHQAEINVKQCPTTFIPFSVNLGYTVLAIYKSLITIIISESSLPILTQALKCLAVLVQSSPFKQFEKGFVQNFVKNLKPFIYHRDATIQVSALMVMEFLVAYPETTCDIAEAIGFPQEVAMMKKMNVKHTDSEQVGIVDIEEFAESEGEVFVNQSIDESAKKKSSNNKSVDQTSWLLRRVLYNLSKEEHVIPTSVRIESLQLLTVMCSYFAIIIPNLTKVSKILVHSLRDVLPDIRLYAARCADACAYQINSYLLDNISRSELEIRECTKFWHSTMPLITSRIQRDSEEITAVRIVLCDAISNIGSLMFKYSPHAAQISLLGFLSGISSDSTEEPTVRATAVRALAVFALYPALQCDLVLIENTAELTLRLVEDSNLLVRVKSFWSLATLSDALIVKGIKIYQLSQERISDDLLYRLINAATVACSDNDKVRCNAVRSLGNLLRLLNDEYLNNDNKKLNWRQIFAKSIYKLSDCIRSSGNAKVKWNACYSITNLMHNPTIYKMYDLRWQATLFPALCHVIVNHSNFKVRINASAAITNIMERSHFGIYYEKFSSSVLEAIEQSYNLDNFHEYNHRDYLQEQLCLALSHVTKLAIIDDLPLLQKHLIPRAEIVHQTWKRVINRMVPEKAAPLVSCSVFLLERGKHQTLTIEQRKVLDFLMEIFSTD